MSGRLVQRLGHVVGIFPVDRLQMQSNPGMKCQSTEKFLGQAGIVFPNAFLRKSRVEDQERTTADIHRAESQRLIHRQPKAPIPGYTAFFAQRLSQGLSLIHILQSNDKFSHDKATKELGYHPRDLYQTLADTIAWMKGKRKEIPAT